MEEDRAASNLGPVLADLNGDDETAEKKPKRRFIGRKAAEQKAATRAEQDGGTIEDSGAIQGAAPETHTRPFFQTTHEKLTEDGIQWHLAAGPRAP